MSSNSLTSSPAKLQGDPPLTRDRAVQLRHMVFVVVLDEGCHHKEEIVQEADPERS